MPIILLQGTPTSDGLAGVLAALLAVVLIGGGYAYHQLRQQRQGLETRLRALLAQQQQHQHPPHPQGSGEADQRNAVMFDQHRRLNELQIAKLGAELELLTRQVKSKSLDEDRIEASKEYHELMVEKTKLEMDSLRLHIAELRKRMEDWRFGQE